MISAPGTNTGLVIDTTSPTVTAMLLTDTGSSATDGITSKDALTGTAEAGGTVTINNGATGLGTTTAATNGSWSYVLTGLADVSHSLTASETDAAGNTGATPVSFALDTTIPGCPDDLSLAGERQWRHRRRCHQNHHTGHYRHRRGRRSCDAV